MTVCWVWLTYFDVASTGLVLGGIGSLGNLGFGHNLHLLVD